MGDDVARSLNGTFIVIGIGMGGFTRVLGKFRGRRFVNNTFFANKRTHIGPKTSSFKLVFYKFSEESEFRI